MAFDRAPETSQVELLIPSLSCAGCMGKVERALLAMPGVETARANLTARRAMVRYAVSETDPEALVEVLDAAGFPARPVDSALEQGSLADLEGRALLLRVGVAGFAAMNVMLLSISVWSGADAATRDLLHWVSALIALPAIAYAGVPFFRSACAALSGRRLNMDVPISLAIILSAASSVVETANHGEHAYFDAGIMLIFFLLIGRYLEHRTQAGARSAAAELMAMAGRTAMRLLPDGARQIIKVGELAPGMILEIAAGERVPADGRIVDGTTELDRALVTGESVPEAAGVGDAVLAGVVNLSGVIRMEVTATGDGTLLAEIARMVDAAERGRGRYDRLADRAARIYAPGVHLLALLAFVGWYAIGGDLHLAIQIAIAVLIVTCPCALALAVPTVHTVASGALFRRGLILKDGTELERLADVDMVVFDKTGTLTKGTPRLAEAPSHDHPCWPLVAALAQASRHPLAGALAGEAGRRGIVSAPVEGIAEFPGLGVEGFLGESRVRLGRAGWAGGSEGADGVHLYGPDGDVSVFRFEETLRAEAVETCQALSAQGVPLALLSGDNADAAHRVAALCGIGEVHAGLMPGDKVAYLEKCRRDGRRVLMVGDGLNDTPALAAAHASISPASAADVAKTAAGLVFTTSGLGAVTLALTVARTARRRALQSFGIAAVYNTIAIPLAVAGFVTPLIAAAAMSASSILVVLNALRLKGDA